MPTYTSERSENGERSDREIMKLNNIVNKVKLLSQRVLAIIVFLLIWEITPRIGLLDPVFIPPASVVFSALGDLIVSGVLQTHASISLQRSFTGFAVAIVIGIPLGFAVGWYKTFDKYIDPLLQTFRQIPTLALFPVLIILLGIGETSKIALIAKASIWVILLNTITGVRSVDPLLIKSARSMGISNFDMFKKVVLPAATPSVFTGLRLAGTASLLVLIAAEMLGAKSGLGYALTEFQVSFRIPEMYAIIVTLTILGLAINYALLYLEKKASHWKEELPNT